MGFSTEQGQLDRVSALIAARRKAVSVAEIARAVPILAPDNFLIPCLGVSVPAVRLSSDELDRFIDFPQCAPVALSKTIFGTDDDEEVNNERPMNSRYQPTPDTQPDSYSRTIGGQLSGNMCGGSPLAAVRWIRGGGWQSDPGRDGKLSQGVAADNAGPSCSKPRSGKAGFFLAAGVEESRNEAMEYRVNNREENYL